MDNCKNIFITNIMGAVGAISEMRLSMLDNLKMPLGSRRSAPIIIGGLATGFLIYYGHRWLSAASSAPKAIDTKSTTTATTATSTTTLTAEEVAEKSTQQPQPQPQQTEL